VGRKKAPLINGTLMMLINANQLSRSLAIVLVACSTTVLIDCSTIHHAQTQQDMRYDAMMLLAAASFIPGARGYCATYVGPDPDFITAVSGWHERNEEFMTTVAGVIAKTGGLSATERDSLDRSAREVIKNKIEAESNKTAYCFHMRSAINSGQLDLDRQEDTRAALARIIGRNSDI
jgi:hypothetical protein